jgi:hypothetical protein
LSTFVFVNKNSLEQEEHHWMNKHRKDERTMFMLTVSSRTLPNGKIFDGNKSKPTMSRRVQSIDIERMIFIYKTTKQTHLRSMNRWIQIVLFVMRINSRPYEHRLLLVFIRLSRSCYEQSYIVSYSQCSSINM